jgi:hypothetical protein
MPLKLRYQSYVFVNEVAKLSAKFYAGLRLMKLYLYFWKQMKKTLLLILVFTCLMFRAKAQFETVKDSVVQLFGIVMTADSLKGIEAVSVTIRGSNRGTITNSQGVFSIVALKGDIIDFTHIQYKPKTVVVPRNIEGNQYSIVQLMIEDTVYLPATIIRPRPTPQQFARDFVNNKVPDDDIEVARQNNTAAKRRALMQSTPGDAGEATTLQMQNIATKATYQGQVPPMNIFSPAAWSEFIQSWKRGDFKKKQ